MKKYSLLSLILLFILVFACSKSSTNNTDDDANSEPVDKSANLLATGDSANDILSNNNFTILQVEIAYVVGFRPTDAAIAEFDSYLREHTFKQGVELIFKELPSPDEEDLSLDEIDDLEKENRTAYNNGNTLAIYIYFADAPSEDDDDDEGLVTLGAVYRNTSMVIYESTIRKLTSLNSSISVADVEGATLNHEFGHLFGLVNIGTTPVNDHEDVQLDEDGNTVLDSSGNPVGNNHCDVVGCLMRAELQFGGSKQAAINAKTSDENGLKADCSLTGKSMMKILESSLIAKGAAPDLDPECILDLQSNGGR